MPLFLPFPPAPSLTEDSLELLLGAFLSAVPILLLLSLFSIPTFLSFTALPFLSLFPGFVG